VLATETIHRSTASYDLRRELGELDECAALMQRGASSIRYGTLRTCTRYESRTRLGADISQTRVRRISVDEDEAKTKTDMVARIDARIAIGSSAVRQSESVVQLLHVHFPYRSEIIISRMSSNPTAINTIRISIHSTAIWNIQPWKFISKI